MTEDIEADLESALAREFGGNGTQAAMRAVDRMTASRPRHEAFESDGMNRRIEMLRGDISRHDAAMIDLARRRDVEVRQRSAEIEEAKRAFDELTSRLDREITEIESKANRRIELRAQLRESSAASLAVLEKPAVRGATS